MTNMQLPANEINIRFATTKDIDAVIVLLDQITCSIQQAGSEWAGYKVDADFERKRKTMRDILLSEGKVFIAESAGEIVGAIHFEVMPNIRHGWKRGHIEEVIVRDEYRGKGVGTLLMNAVKKYCREQDIHVIKLSCGNQLENSHRFYEKNGFEFTDRGYRYTVS